MTKHCLENVWRQCNEKKRINTNNWIKFWHKARKNFSVSSSAVQTHRLFRYGSSRTFKNNGFPGRIFKKLGQHRISLKEFWLKDSLKFLKVFLKSYALFLKVLEGILEDSSRNFRCVWTRVPSMEIDFCYSSYVPSFFGKTLNIEGIRIFRPYLNDTSMFINVSLLFLGV